MIQDIPNHNFRYPKSWFGALPQIVIWYTIPNHDLMHYPKLRFSALSQITIWCIIPITIWCITSNYDLVHYSKSRFGTLSQVMIWYIIPKYIRKWSFWYKMLMQKTFCSTNCCICKKSERNCNINYYPTNQDCNNPQKCKILWIIILYFFF